jgi:hypothetical protein
MMGLGDHVYKTKRLIFSKHTNTIAPYFAIVCTLILCLHKHSHTHDLFKNIANNNLFNPFCSHLESNINIYSKRRVNNFSVRLVKMPDIPHSFVMLANCWQCVQCLADFQ